MRRLLWIGDAAVSSGFARATHYTLETLRKTWDVQVLGINYDGDPHTFPYPIYTCRGRFGGDAFGIKRSSELVELLKPDLVVVQSDPWNFPQYCKRIDNAVPVVGAVAVDGKNCRGDLLNGLSMAIFWTEFGKHEACIGGYQGRTAVVPLGVDLNIYTPGDRKLARDAANLSKHFAARGHAEPFIVGNVNRNQPRKRLDLTIEYFAEWVKSYKIDDAYLYLHVAPTGDPGYDVGQLMKYYGLQNRLIHAEPEIGHGVPEAALVNTYRTFDVQLSTTQGEGFGLTTFEGMACGIPQIVPDWSALGELCRDAAVLAPCPTTCVTPNNINAIGGVANKHAVVEALDALYRSKEMRDDYTAAGLARVREPRFRWENIGQAFSDAIDDMIQAKVS